jgi:signal transduction histidine kinase
VVNASPFIAAALERHELSETMRQLNKRMIETEERERARMAIDLHDGPLQKAVALAWGRAYGSEDPKEIAMQLVTELREISSRLRPSILDDLGLPSSIEWLLEHNLKGTGIHGSLTLQGLEADTRLPGDVELALFRVTQEAMNNAVKHAKCSEMKVALVLEDDQLSLTIRDNGVGVGGVGSGEIPSSRLGLVGMRERVMQVGGHLEVRSRLGEGMTVQATIPMDYNAANR